MFKNIANAFRIPEIRKRLLFTLLMLLVIGVTVFISYRSAMNGRLSKSDLILRDEEKPEGQGEAKALSAWIGRQGDTATALRPGGTISIEGQQVNAARPSESGGRVSGRGTLSMPRSRCSGRRCCRVQVCALANIA